MSRYALGKWSGENEGDKEMGEKVFVRMEDYIKKGIQLRSEIEKYIHEDKASIDNFIGKNFVIQNKEYYCGSYDRYFEARVGHPVDKKEDSRIFKTEVLQGEQILDFNYYAKENTMLALMPLQKKQEITIKADKIELKLGKLLHNHYHYYTFEKDSRIEIKSAETFVVSKPFLLVQDAKKPKVIVNLFVDGLSWEYLNTIGLEELMPNTYSFFREGTICRNAWSNLEWMHPNMASIFTGRYTLGKAGHRIFQPDYCSKNLYEMELFPEILQQNGYVCAKIDGEWRSTPISGYAKGMDRTLYQPSLMNMFGDNAIMEMVEHLETFQNCNNFVWVALPELHDISDEFESTVSTQMNTSLKYRKIEHTNGTSVRRGFDEGKVMRYKAQIKRIDVLLGIVYSYIESNYKEDEYIVSLMSDHGQGYLTQDNNEFFDEHRNKIAMLFRGHEVPKGVCDELVESVDLFPILLKCAGEKDFDCKDGNVPKWFGGYKEKEYAISESVFPGSPYYAAINDDKYTFFFTTEKVCSSDGYLDVSGYKVRLVEKNLKKDVTKQNREAVIRYTDIVLNHIKEHIKSI